jgi:F-type H+-transporting ATPase subunit delta
MKDLILVKRYTQGLVGALQDEPEFISVHGELGRFQELVSSHGVLKDTLASPFVAALRKTRVIKDVLAAAGFSDKTSRFILLLFGHNRLGLLGAILEELPVSWNERQGVATYEVSSVVALAEAQKRRLMNALERLENRPVFLRYSIDPELVAGFSLKKGNVVYDGSLKGNLAKIKERISKG